MKKNKADNEVAVFHWKFNSLKQELIINASNCVHPLNWPKRPRDKNTLGRLMTRDGNLERLRPRRRTPPRA
jgi:hypothetical protein